MATSPPPPDDRSGEADEKVVVTPLLVIAGLVAITLGIAAGLVMSAKSLFN